MRLVDLDLLPLQHWANDQYFIVRLAKVTNFTQYARLFLVFIVMADGTNNFRRATEKDTMKKETLKAI